MGDVFKGIGNIIAAPIKAVSGALGFGGTQQQSSSSGVQQSAFAQFPDLQKAIAEFGFGNVQSLAQPLSNRISLPTPTYNLNANGLFPEQQQAFQTAVQQAMGTSSADYAQRGFLRPENINAIAGSAAQNVMPQFAPLIGAQVGTAKVLPEQTTQNRINQLMQLISTYPGLLGGMATNISQGTTNFPSFFQAVLPAFAEGLGQGAGGGVKCWIAQALYGSDNWRVPLVRDWLNQVIAQTWYGKWFVMWYAKHGSRMASIIRCRPLWQVFWRPIFDLFVMLASRRVSHHG